MPLQSTCTRLCAFVGVHVVYGLFCHNTIFCIAAVLQCFSDPMLVTRAVQRPPTPPPCRFHRQTLALRRALESHHRWMPTASGAHARLH